MLAAGLLTLQVSKTPEESNASDKPGASSHMLHNTGTALPLKSRRCACSGLQHSADRSQEHPNHLLHCLLFGCASLLQMVYLHAAIATKHKTHVGNAHSLSPKADTAPQTTCISQASWTRQVNCRKLHLKCASKCTHLSPSVVGE
jgi:hypothetical protein